LVSLNCGAPKQYEKEKTNWAENHRFFLSGSFMKTANSLRFFFLGEITGIDGSLEIGRTSQH
jgi:hypothetical protein